MISDLSDDGMAVEGEFWVCLTEMCCQGYHIVIATEYTHS